MNVGDIRRAIEGVPDNTFVNIDTISKPIEVSSIFPRHIVFNPLPGAGPYQTTSEGRDVVGTVTISVEVSDATWGHERHAIIMKHAERAREKARKELAKKGLQC